MKQAEENGFENVLDQAGDSSILFDTAISAVAGALNHEGLAIPNGSSFEIARTRGRAYCW